MRNIGFRAHDFGSFGSALALGERVAQTKSPAVIQLALNKVIPSSRPWTEWDEEYISAVRDDLAKSGVSAAVVGCYINPVHPDEEARKKEVARFRRSLELSKAFGCPVVGTETGSWSSDISYNPGTYTDKVFSVFLRSLEEMVSAAEANGAVCAIEPVAHSHTICSAARLARVLETFPSDHLRVIFDPVNLIPVNGIAEADGSHRAVPTPEAFRSFWNEALDAFGDKIVAFHCKDYVLGPNGLKKGDMPVLTGVFDWKGFFRELDRRGIDKPILLENHNPATLPETIPILESF